MSFLIDHAKVPKGGEHREMCQFINSMEVRSQMERIHCSSITVVPCDYTDRQSGNQCQGYFIARKDNPAEPLLLIAEKKGGKGGGLFRYEAVPSSSVQNGWSNAVPVEELVH